MKKIKGYFKNYLKEVSDDGFSLLELVVAVGILLVLTVGGLLAYNGLTKNARVAAVQSAADEVHTGAVAYDSNGEKVAKAVEEWNSSSKKDKDEKASIVVNAWKSTTGAICAEAEMESHDITVKRGAGCDGVPADNGGNGDDIVITDPATAASCFGFDPGAGMITYYKEFDEGCGTDVVIPATIDSVAVVGIDRYAFNGVGLTSVVIPDGVETIGDSAFSNNDLTSVEFNDGLESIGDHAFYENYNLAGSVVFPGSVKTIGDYAFYENGLTSVVFNEGLETIGSEAFMKNPLTGHIDFPNSLVSIGDQAFADSNLTSVSFSSNTDYKTWDFNGKYVIINVR